MYLRTCAKQIMINLVISKSNSNESLSQIKAEASIYLMANSDKKACLQHLFKAEKIAVNKRKKLWHHCSFYKDIILA